MSNMPPNSLQEGEHNLQEMKTKSPAWSSKGYHMYGSRHNEGRLYQLIHEWIAQVKFSDIFSTWDEIFLVVTKTRGPKGPEPLTWVNRPKVKLIIWINLTVWNIPMKFESHWPKDSGGVSF